MPYLYFSVFFHYYWSVFLPPILLPKSEYPEGFIYCGTPQGRKRFRDEKGARYFEWDSLHGEFEIYNKQGMHLGVMTKDGKRIKKAIKGRYIDV
jgi:hypothetical protein